MVSCSKDSDGPKPHPGELKLVAPENNATDIDPHSIQLEWQMPKGVDESSIAFYVSIGYGNGDIFESVAGPIQENSYALAIPPVYEETIYWKVEATDGNGLELESEVFAFTTRTKTIEDSLLGLWLGTYGFGDHADEYPYGFLFRPNGTMRVYNNDTPFTTAQDTLNLPDNYKTEGIYNLNGSVVSGTYVWYEDEDEYPYSFESTINLELDFMLGTWGEGENVSGNGHYYVEKAISHGESAN